MEYSDVRFQRKSFAKVIPVRFSSDSVFHLKCFRSLCAFVFMVSTVLLHLVEKTDNTAAIMTVLVVTVDANNIK